MALESQLGEGIVVRSDDVDGNTVTGVAVNQVGEHPYVANFTDGGDVISCELQ